MKIIIDDDGEIIGCGDDDRSAQSDAMEFLRSDLAYLRALVEDMTCGEATPELQEAIKVQGSVSCVRLADGRFGLHSEGDSDAKTSPRT